MAQDKLIQKNIRFPESLWRRVEDATGEDYTASDFVRDAVREKLARIESEERIARLEARLKRLEEQRHAEEDG